MVEEAKEQETKFTYQIRDWRNTVTDKFLGLFPRRTAEHLVNAQKEGLLAVRSLLDRGIEILDGDLKPVNDRPPRNYLLHLTHAGTKIAKSRVRESRLSQEPGGQRSHAWNPDAARLFHYRSKRRCRCHRREYMRFH